MDIRKRGIAAARAYLERIDQEVLPEGKPLPAGIDLLSIDGDTLVATLVGVRSGTTPDDVFVHRKVDHRDHRIVDHLSLSCCAAS
jgi:LmbE family N-acetylglucosaminyl deacetylase